MSGTNSPIKFLLSGNKTNLKTDYSWLQKSVRDSVKYHHADPSVDYMTFLEECRKAWDEDRAGKPKPKGKLKMAAATISSTPNDLPNN